MSIKYQAGFWTLTSFVVGSQVGSGILILPSVLAPYGKSSLWGWVLSGLMAMVLTVMFSHLCARYPRTGGPYIYLKATMNSKIAYSMGFIYWLVSWMSSSTVIITASHYLFPHASPFQHLMYESVMVLWMMVINLKGMRTSGRWEIFFSLMKVIPLVILPLAIGWQYSHVGHSEMISRYVVSDHAHHAFNTQAWMHCTLLTFWGFIGLETATTPASSVKNPTRTIPMAMMAGTALVWALYVLNHGVMIFCVPSHVLNSSLSAYQEAATFAFGSEVGSCIAGLSGMICLGTLNAWVFASSQIFLGLHESHQNNLNPSQDTRRIERLGVILSSLGVWPILWLDAQTHGAWIAKFIDTSVHVFLVIYAICALAHWRIYPTWKYRCISMTGLLFCMSILILSITSMI